jgi:hypothetical protein
MVKKKSKSTITFKTKYDKRMQYENGDFFEVEAIRGRKGIDLHPEYNVKWKGWPESTNTWQAAADLKNVRHLVEEFEKKQNPGKDLSFLDVHFKDSGPVSAESEPEGELDHDVPMNILKSKKINGIVMLKIDWMVRTKTGYKPSKSWVNREDFIKKNLIMLIDYYEKHLRFCK